MTRRVAVAALAAALFGIGLQASGVDGKWTAQVPGRGGQTRDTTFNFKADGETLTGTMSGFQDDVPLSEGKIAGDQISFAVTLSFQGNEVKLLFKGTLKGDEIAFTRQREGSDQVSEFTATRAK